MATTTKVKKYGVGKDEFKLDLSKPSLLKLLTKNVTIPALQIQKQL